MRQSRCVGPPPRHHAVVLTSFCIRRCDKRFNAGKHATARPQRHPAPRPQTLSGPNQTPTTLGELCGLETRGEFFSQARIWLPSVKGFWPVVWEAASLTKKVTMLAWSAGWAKRPRGLPDSVALETALLQALHHFVVVGVHEFGLGRAGEIVLARMRRGTGSRASTWVRPRSSDFAAASSTTSIAVGWARPPRLVVSRAVVRSTWWSTSRILAPVADLGDAQRAGPSDAAGTAGHDGGLGPRSAPARLLDLDGLSHEALVSSLGPRLAS